ncbi:hypothetical protein CONLIGDRAFT_43314 [Coniochaeta ligniaria NRRL 30616]|uniref:Uncharacterized protein n=1 Tax=Coniochaeta ligniaria NRRL 30616 TaxID=1408157 RepID=A0A1J7J4U9_9PEZI|nr:hypothetical protein CONLIGDRAFT_43314 [Coniochaeta ligniaria NRRL 30616]
MRTRSAVAVLGLGLLSTVASGAPYCESPDEALQWFNYGVPVPTQCVQQMSEQALSFCSSYFASDPITTITTGTTTSTEIATETATTTSTYVYAPLGKRRADPVPSCPGNCINLATDCMPLTEPNLIRRPAASLDLYCRCLGVNPTTVTVSYSTATASSTTTETAVETEVVSETTISTEIEVTVATETTTQTEVSHRATHHLPPKRVRC